MRRRTPWDADTRLFLSRFLRAVDRTDLPGHSAALLLYISGQPGYRAGYATAARELKLNKGQMERAVTVLDEMKLIIRVDDPADARRKQLQILEAGEDVIGKIHDHAKLTK